ncbi:MAG TPA: glycosyltransferase family 2 protein [Anaerolineaceae bacterium]
MGNVLSIIIVSWNTRALLRNCLTSLLEALPAQQTEVWVVDNASSDGSVQMIREEFSGVHVIANVNNGGFAAGNNQILPFCTGQYILLLNPDTVVKPGALQGMLDYLEAHPETGAVGPRLLNGDGSFQLSVFPFPTLSRELWRLLHLDRLASYALYDLNRWDLSTTHEVDSIQGACLMIRRAVVEKVGLFDADYFLYSEEIDLCYRIQKAGWSLVWLPQVVVIHLGGQSAQQEARKSFLNLYRGKVLFFRKHYGNAQALAYRGVLAFTALARLAVTPLVWLEPASRRDAHLKLAGNYLYLLKAIPGL